MDKQVGYNVSQEEPTDRDLNPLQLALNGQSMAGRLIALPPATPSISGELKPLSPTKP
jgi:hypothetical protein